MDQQLVRHGFAYTCGISEGLHTHWVKACPHIIRPAGGAEHLCRVLCRRAKNLESKLPQDKVKAETE